MIAVLARISVLVLTAAVLLYLPATRLVAQDAVEKKIESQQKELDKIKREIDQHQRKSQELKKVERAEIEKLNDLDRDLDLARRYLTELRKQESLFTDQIDSLSTMIVMESERLAAHEHALGQRLRQMYMRDPHHRFEVIAGSNSIKQAMTRYKFMQIIAEQDAQVITTYRESKRRLQVQTATLTESLSEVAVVRQQSESQSLAMQTSRKKRESALKNIRTKKSQHAKAIKELEKAQGEVKDLIGSLERRRLEQERLGIVDTGDFAKLKGRMTWPVKGKVLRGYGKITHPKYGTVTFNNGIDIKASSGAPIIAVASGVVEFVDWIDAYGKCLIINHGGGYYTLYAHVASTFVAQGKNVVAGDVIAEVGDTGSLDGYTCHFEIRKSKQALDPLKWLERRRGSS